MLNNNIIEEKRTLIKYYSIFFVVVFPILEAYSIFGISITFILSLLIIFLNFLYKKKNEINIKKIYVPLLLYVLFTCVLSMNGFLVLNNYKNLLNAVIMQLINVTAFLIAWENIEFDQMIAFADVIAYVCCLFVCVQFFMLITGKEVPLGKLPFLEVHTTWIPEIWGFRFNSFFSEPSYFAIFLLPVFAVHFLNFEWKKTVFFGIFILLSSSSLGIITMITIIITRTIAGNIRVKSKIKIILGIMCIVLAFYFVLSNSTVLNNILYRTFDKTISIFNNQNGVNDIRLIGHLKYFSLLPIKEKMFGVGISQLQNYFLEHGYNLSNYSNSFVLTIINSGIIGLIVLMIFLIYLLKISLKNKSLIFFIILFFTLLVDSILIGYRFYWLCMYIFLFKPKEENKI